MGMERKRKVYPRVVVGELSYLLRNAGRAHRDAPWRHTQTLRRGNALNALHHRAIGQQRFAHSHVNDVGQRMPEGRFALAVHQQHLVVNLGSIEVAYPLHLASGAKGAGQAATDLARHADREAAVIRHRYQHRLDEVAIVQPETGFDGAIIAVLHFVLHDKMDGEILV
jgi:hypothetical protein